MPEIDPSTRSVTRSATRRLAWSVALAAGSIVAASVMVPTYGQFARHGADLVKRQHDREVVAARARAAEAKAHLDSGTAAAIGVLTADGHTHNHNNPATKNSISRTTGDKYLAGTQDPTTPLQAAVGAGTVAQQRKEPSPKLVPLSQRSARRTVPESRYAMAGGCYALKSQRTGKWVGRNGEGFRAAAGSYSGGLPLHFQATDLGRYLLYGDRPDFVSQHNDVLGSSDQVESTADPSTHSDWTVDKSGDNYLFRIGGKYLNVGDGGALALGTRKEPFRMHTTSGCAHWDEVDVDVSGTPFGGVSPMQEVRGLIDAHTHGMAFEFLGGDVHCGKPWSIYGVADALKDCPDHYIAGGRGAALEDLLNSGQPGHGHDPVGWPTFKDWPAPHSLTHEGTYYKWMERAWRGGLRVFTNLLVENGKLCQVYPIKHNSCDDMTSIRLQASDMHKMERFIDAQYGGPGKGWYRIVTNPFQARQVINRGKLAVVMGIETSVLFGCTMKNGIPDPSCTKASIDRQLDQVHKMGVSQMELVNKFDNALSGVAGDEGQTGIAVNSANFLETGSYWKMQHCPSSYAADVHDKNQVAAPDPSPFSQRDGLFGAVQQLFGVDPPQVAPLYAPAPHCNELGLTDLGAYTIRGMIKRHMIFDPDHMSVRGRKASLSLLEKAGYSGVVSSHSWATPDAYPRIYKLGGFITPYAGDSAGFVDKWRKHMTWADPRYYWGFGYGADMNGLGAQGNPRGANVSNPVTYPFKGLGGVTVSKQHSGQRVYDINKDGVAHYGLYPDWLQDLRMVAGATGDSGSDGSNIVKDMSRGPEAYLQMWERAQGVSNDGCRDARALKRASVIRSLPHGASVKTVLVKAGQPHSRLGRTFDYCARSTSGKTTHVTVKFGAGNTLTKVT